MSLPDVIITGIGGYGRLHLENGRRLQDAGRLRIVALVDPVVAAQRDADDGIPIYADLGTALARHHADIVTVATPLDTHRTLAEQAMRAGADVYLEKPPVPTIADFEHLLAVQREAGRAVQVGFQSLGSLALDAFATDAFTLGPTVAVAATGLWSRALGYWGRARWAGRRTLDGHPVVDGVATNPLAHAVATALRIAGYDTAESVDAVEVELFRVNSIESDDTSVVRISGAGRPTVTCALTLCAPPEFAHRDDRGATVTVLGENGSAVFSYTTDVVALGAPPLDSELGSGFDDLPHREFGRVDLLENLLDHREHGTDLIVPLSATGAFLRVVEAIRLASPPAMIDPTFVTWHEQGDDGTSEAAYPVLDDVVRTVRTASAEGRLFSELAAAERGAPWSLGRRDDVIARAALGGTALDGAGVDGTVVATEVDGGATTPFSSPHPYLHPVRTLGGVTVTAAHPADHDWHTGVSFTVQDADGVNFWGGRTYVRDQGYQVLGDQGRIEVVATRAADTVAAGATAAAVATEHKGAAADAAASPAETTGRAVAHATVDGVEHDLVWRGPDGAVVLNERRGIRWWPLGPGVGSASGVGRASNERDAAAAWALEIDVRLTPGEGRSEVVVQSPGSKGREAAGYGGFFWRLPECIDVDVFTADAAGEDAVNGSRSPWFAWTGRFLAGESGGGRNGEASLVLVAPDSANEVPAGGAPAAGVAAAGVPAAAAPDASETRRADPWFVRLRDYPGIGVAVAWDAPTVVPAEGFSRRYRAAIVDGRISSDDAARLAARLRD